MPITLDGGAGVTFPDAVQQTNALTNTGGTPRYYAARAWVVFDGTVSPPTILSAVNVSSVTRNTTGNYTVTFSSAMPNTNYAINVTARATGSSAPVSFVDGSTTPTASAIVLQLVAVSWPSGTANSSAYDSSRVSVAIFA